MPVSSAAAKIVSCDTRHRGDRYRFRMMRAVECPAHDTRRGVIGQSCGPYLKRVPDAVPIDRHDEPFFAPLRDLRLGQRTELCLGLVHARDGVEGTKRRVAAASCVVERFGIASECGISRGRDPRLAQDFIQTYAEVARS
jgi:hypothetical protein